VEIINACHTRKATSNHSGFFLKADTSPDGDACPTVPVALEAGSEPPVKLEVAPGEAVDAAAVPEPASELDGVDPPAVELPPPTAPLLPFEPPPEIFVLTA
jgi:hypothetical protein